MSSKTWSEWSDENADAIESAERKQMSETPRTDAHSVRPTTGLEYAPACLARQLERELNEARGLLRQVLEETVDRVPYPDGPCLDRETRAEIKRLLQ